MLKLSVIRSFKQLITVIIKAQSEHLAEIDRIYNQAIEDGFRTAHLKPLTAEERQSWFDAHPEDSFPIFVCIENDAVLGWISISPYRSGRGALGEVAEVSYYVDYAHHGNGIASKLMGHAIAYCRESPFRILVAILVSNNDESKGLLHKFDFEEAGRVNDAFSYAGELRDHVYMSLNIT